MSGLQDRFSHVARAASHVVGRPEAFLGALAVIVVWGIAGPAFHYSDTWQLIINTGTTIITFLIVFLIQNAQNHDARSIQLKLDELIRATQDASNRLVAVEDDTDESLTALRAQVVEHSGRTPPAGRA